MQSFQFTLNPRRSNTAAISSTESWTLPDSARDQFSILNKIDILFFSVTPSSLSLVRIEVRDHHHVDVKSITNARFPKGEKVIPIRVTVYHSSITSRGIMDNRAKLIHGRSSVILAVVVASVLAIFIEAAEGRPHIRHHRDGSHCSRCGPGWGVISRCTRGRDTRCGRCPTGTYSPHHSAQPCWNCARCGPGLYEAHPCTSHSDTVCDSCHRPAPDNPDYRRKCEGRAKFFLAPEDARSTAEESVLVNEPAYQFQLNDRERILEKDVEAIMRDQAAGRQEDP